MTLLGLPRRLLGVTRRFVVRTVDRALHQRRHPAAKRRVAELGQSSFVLMVCHGNICRSPYAAGALVRVLAGNRAHVRIGSAGFIGPGRASPSAAVQVAAERGVDLSGHVSAVLTPDAVRDAGVVVVMDTRQRRMICDRFGARPAQVILLGDLDPTLGEPREIPDPVDKPAEVFRSCYARIDRCIDQFARALPNGSRKGPG